MAQGVKDPVLSLLWVRFLLWCGFDPCHRPDPPPPPPKKKKKQKKLEHLLCVRYCCRCWEYISAKDRIPALTEVIVLCWREKDDKQIRWHQRVLSIKIMK